MDADCQGGSRLFAHRAGSGDAACVRVDDAGQLIAAVPAILRFIPTRSLVVALVSAAADSAASARAIPVVVRVDLDAVTDPARAQEPLELLDTVFRRENATATFAIVVDDRPHATATAHLVVALLQSMAVNLAHAWLVPTISAGATYRGLLDGDSDGTVNDPATSPLALALALDGVAIHHSRSQLRDLIAVDPQASAALSPLIATAVEHYRGERADAATADHGATFHRDTACAVLERISAVAESGCTPEGLATVVAALRDVVIRDVMLALTGTSWAADAQILWQSVARASTGRDRAEAAMLCGYDAYHRGDGVYARICLEAALQADSEHSIAVLLKAALDGGEPPARIAMIADAGRDIATGLRIDLTTTT
ncbi:hypothetical protein NCAST_19_00960 [Nocardia asteroides NBRC 15531]|uniref:DUF4192 domain-containing protein n=1 Tax=Nocardia asteroides NBRC 15531 TaxID=1110697 RepID=U5EDX1_NOCAS|nr:hypothetical protein NCAST_19_00960 [Nocardia asteroides NBRC 15531]SFN81748.1 protein of unknown function [Nocardia asteroides]VEG36416.1 Uncharacterised protein [Nocardia asteroides]